MTGIYVPGQDVTGYDVDGYDVEGEVVGDVVGDVVGARGGRPRAILRLPPRPAWRTRGLAPGVVAPHEGLVPLPLAADSLSITGGGAQWTGGSQAVVTFVGRPQKPYRGERLQATIVRAGATVARALALDIYVGTDLQQAQVGSTDLEFYGPGALDTRWFLTPCQPGVEIRLRVQPHVAVAGADTLTVFLSLLGRYMH